MEPLTLTTLYFVDGAVRNAALLRGATPINEPRALECRRILYCETDFGSQSLRPKTTSAPSAAAFKTATAYRVRLFATWSSP